jgi:hypothetical protein
MVKAKFEIYHVPESISLPLQCFDFIDRALNRAAGYPVREKIQYAFFVLNQC